MSTDYPRQRRKVEERIKMPKQEVFDAQKRSMDLLWGEKRESSRGPKPGLSIHQIAWAAISVADAEGLEAVSMQRVAHECGVTTMALYRYVPDKAGLLALMIDIGIGAPPALDSIRGGWRPQLEEWARRLWVTFHDHPWSLGATAPVRLIGPNELGWLEAAISALSGIGLTGREMVDAVDAILVYVRNRAYHSTNMALKRQSSAEEGWESVMARILSKHSDRFPAVVATGILGTFDNSERETLEFGLRLVLDGLGVRIAERPVRHKADE
jgi:AcrR family transcriptional regulator